MSTKDVYDYQLGEDVASRIQQASELLSSDNYELGQPLVRKLSGRLIRIPRTWEDKILIRHVNRKLRLAKRVDFPNRHAIVSQIASLLQSDVPLRILRTDIRKFFDSADIAETVQMLLRVGCFRQREEKVLLTIHNHWSQQPGKGLPWGISLSSTIAELVLRDFDQAIVRTPGILYFRRFVDDIIVVAPAHSEFSIQNLEAALPSGLKFGSEKSFDIIEPASSGSSCSNSFDYLGYRFERSLKHSKRRYIPEVSIGISDRKIERLEQRIKLVGKQFRNDGSLRDLSGRLRMLTGNYLIKKAGHPKPIPVGIYFNYPIINDLSGLDRLDAALRNQLVSLRIYSRRNELPTSDIKRRMKYSFRVGHSRRIKHRLSDSDILNFRAIWAYG